MLSNLLEKEDALRAEWLSTYSPKEQKSFCFDGLLSTRNGDTPEAWQAEVQKWENAKRKVLFLMKDTNNNPGDDIRAWPLTDESSPNGTLSPFYTTLLKWLVALNEVTKDYLPQFDKTREEYIALSRKYPMAQVNIKKISGNASVSNAEVMKYFERDKKFLTLQIRGILMPNIILCGGGDGLIKDIVIEHIYADYDFVQVNDCYYDKSHNLLVIDSYHPSAHVSNEEKFDAMIKNVYALYNYKSVVLDSLWENLKDKFL